MKIAYCCWVGLVAAAALAVDAVPAAAREVVSAKPNANLELARQLNQAFVQVAEEVSPVVVVITVTQKAAPVPHLFPEQNDGQSDEEDPLNQFKKFFRQRPEETPEPTRGQGSGIIIRKDGYILTNRHVVEDAEKIEVRLKDGRTFKAQVRGVDAPSDVAVIKIDAQDLPEAKLADSSLTRVGEFAIAIGAPFALDYTVTFGHVSAKDRSGIIPLDGQTLKLSDEEFIQTDANINPGNSGGPLVNIDGEVIGINTLIRGLRTGIGFAIPINLAREVADKLISEGKFTRAWLGINIRSLREWPDLRELMPGVKDGVAVYALVPNGPAAKYDLRPEDVITAVDGKPVVTSQELKDAIRTKKVGQEVSLDVYRFTGKDRQGKQIFKEMKIKVKPGEYEEKSFAANAQPGSSAEADNNGGLGLNIKPLTRDTAEQFGVELTEGVIVSNVDKDGLAERNGIKKGDIITSIDHQPVTNSKQFREAVKNVDVKHGVVVSLISQGTPRFEILKENGE
jgi:serine protease Do